MFGRSAHIVKSVGSSGGRKKHRREARRICMGGPPLKHGDCIQAHKHETLITCQKRAQNSDTRVKKRGRQEVCMYLQRFISEVLGVGQQGLSPPILVSTA